MSRGPNFWSLAGRLVLRPRLYVAGLRTAWRLRRRRWYARPPFLPLPPREYLDWRLHTAYGDEGAAPQSEQVVRYVRWAERMRRGS